MDSENDSRVVREALAGRTEAFADLVEKYQGPVFNLAWRMTGSRQDAEDLAQETFLRAWVGLKNFDPGRRFFPWLFAVAVNTVRNHLKKNQPAAIARLDAGAPEPAAGAGRGPEARLQDKQKMMAMAAALQQLPTDQREALVLRYYQDLPFEDVAAVCGVSLSAAKMRVYRGLQRLAVILDEPLQPDDAKNRSKP